MSPRKGKGRKRGPKPKIKEEHDEKREIKKLKDQIRQKQVDMIILDKYKNSTEARVRIYKDFHETQIESAQFYRIAKQTAINKKKEKIATRTEEQNKELNNLDKEEHLLPLERLNMDRNKKKGTRGRRDKALEVQERICKNQEEKEGAIKHWRLCGLCASEFAATGSRKPIVLHCGHTYCARCLFKLALPQSVTCPYDRQITQVMKNRLERLPVNLALVFK